MFLESGFGEFGVVENFGEQATPNVFASMNRDDSSTPVWVL
jgi:hypothetical protein